MDLQKAFDAGFEMLKGYVDGRLTELSRDDIAPDDVADQIAHALAIVAQPLLLPASPPPIQQQAAPSVVNVAIPPPRKTQKQIKMRRDENNQLIADVIEHDLD